MLIKSILRPLIKIIPPTLLQKVCYKMISLRWILRSGVDIRIDNHMDWVIYNDIFVDREYDLPINRALEVGNYSKARIEILDLGANVGFFAKRVADILLRSDNPALDFRITLVEGSPIITEQLKSRLTEPILSNKARIICGLVGVRSGSAKIYTKEAHGTSSVFAEESKESGQEVSFVDITNLYAHDCKMIFPRKSGHKEELVIA